MLKKINLEGTKVSKISISGDCCPFLQTLHIVFSDDLRELETLPTTLEDIYIFFFDALEDIKGIRGLKNLQDLSINYCEMLEALPSLAELTSLKTIQLAGCHMLEKIEGLESLRSLETLEIRNCQELNGFPSLAELTSLSRFELRACPKLEKIEGLESLTSLTRLVVVANDRSAVEPFISNIQKWPREVIICTNPIYEVCSLESFFEELPNVSVLKYSDMVESRRGLQLRRPESSANANAILICFIIDCGDPNLEFSLSAGPRDGFKTKLGEGKWVWLCIFTQPSDFLRFHYYDFGAFKNGNYVEEQVQEAWLVVGEEGSIVYVFNRLLARATSAEG